MTEKQGVKDVILTDKKENGQERPWKERKEQSVYVSKVLTWGDAYEYLSKTERDIHAVKVDRITGDVTSYVIKNSASTFKQVLEDFSNYKDLIGWLGKKSDKMHDCGETLEFTVNSEGAKRLRHAYFCKDRLCPMCNWRRSRKLTGQVLKILQEMKNEKIEGRPIFLTLSMPNVKDDDISKSFSDYAEGFNRLMKYKVVSKVCIGAIRASEVTYNAKRNDYNTHIHCLLWMKPDYFHKTYINHEGWRSLWERAVKWVPEQHINPKTNEPTHLRVNVKAVKSLPTESDPTGYLKPVLEITKYTAKLTCLFGMVWSESDKEKDKQKMKLGKQISDLERGLYRKRLISFFGIFKELHKKLNLDDVEDGDLINADEEDGNGNTEQVVRYTYDYDRKNYYLTGTGTINKDGMTVYPEDDNETEY